VIKLLIPLGNVLLGLGAVWLGWVGARTLAS
jgi:hypothetical protein